MTLRQKEAAERSEYEGCLIKLEAEVRSHIRVRKEYMKSTKGRK